MNYALTDLFRQLNLEPGTYRCELPEQEILVEVRPRKGGEVSPRSETQSEQRLTDPVTIDDSCIMLDPWVELPGLSGGTILEAQLGKPDLPDVPEIPSYDEDKEGT